MKTSIALILVSFPLLLGTNNSHASGMASQEINQQALSQESIVSVIEVEERVVVHSLPMINYG
jgi:hypothetical protein